MLLTRRGLGVLLVGAVAAAMAHEFGHAVLLEFVFLCVAALAVSALAVARMGGGLVVQRSVPAEVFAGDPVRVRLRVRNDGASKSLFFLSDRPTVAGVKTEVPVLVDSLPAGDWREVGYALPTFRRGTVRFERLVAETRAPFGLVEWRRELVARSSCAVLPRPGRMWDWEAPGGRRHSAIGVETPDRSGASQEFYAVREYRAGDPLRHVHWKLTARSGKLMVREFQTTSSLEVEVIPNASAGDYRGPAAAEMLEGVVALTATLCAELLRRGFYVRLWSAGQELRSTTLDCGPAHVKRLLVELARLEANRTEPYAELLERVAAHFVPRAAVVAVTPYHVLPDVAAVVSRLAAGLHVPQLMVLEPPSTQQPEGVFAPEASVLAAIARSGSPGYRFRADDDFALIRMGRHAARRVGFQGREVAGPTGVGGAAA